MSIYEIVESFTDEGLQELSRAVYDERRRRFLKKYQDYVLPIEAQRVIDVNKIQAVRAVRNSDPRIGIVEAKWIVEQHLEVRKS